MEDLTPTDVTSVQDAAQPNASVQPPLGASVDSADAPTVVDATEIAPALDQQVLSDAPSPDPSAVVDAAPPADAVSPDAVSPVEAAPQVETVSVEVVTVELPPATVNVPYAHIIEDLKGLEGLVSVDAPHTSDFSLETLASKLKGLAQRSGSHMWRLHARRGTESIFVHLKLDVLPAPRPPRLIKQQLANADVGQVYSATLPTAEVSNLRLVSDAELVPGVTLHLDTLRVDGTPSTAGDFDYVLEGNIGDEHIDLRIRLTVIPDPKTLWKDLPSNRDDKFWKEDTAHQQIVSKDAFVIAASKRGRSHAHNGTFRDDDFGISADHSTGWHILISCDGKGSGKYSRAGSQRTVSTILSGLPQLLEQQFSTALLGRIQSDWSEARTDTRTAFWNSVVVASKNAATAVDALAKEHELPLKEFDTTLIVAAAKKLPNGWLIGGFAIGDGGMALCHFNSGRVTPLMTPDSGESAGETRFLALGEFSDSHQINNRLKFEFVPLLDGLYLMSDGITDAKIPTENDLADLSKWEDLILKDVGSQVQIESKNLEASHQLLGWLDFWVPGEHDDRTIVIMKPIEE